MRLTFVRPAMRSAAWPAAAQWPVRSVLTGFVLPVAVVLAIHAALRMTYPGGVETDDADLILFSQAPAWGYSEQPPLYSWLCEPFFRLFGVGVAALTAVRTLVLAAGCALLYLNAR